MQSSNFKVHCNTSSRLFVRQTFSVLDAGAVLCSLKQTENKSPYTWNCKCLTSDEVGPLLSMNRNKQLLSNSDSLDFKKFRQLKGCGMSQVSSKKSV